MYKYSRISLSASDKKRKKPINIYQYLCHFLDELLVIDDNSLLAFIT